MGGNEGKEGEEGKEGKDKVGEHGRRGKSSTIASLFIQQSTGRDTRVSPRASSRASTLSHAITFTLPSHSAKFTPPNEPRKNLLVFPRSLIRKAVSGNPIGHILRKRRVKMIVTLHPAQVLHETYSNTCFRRG